MTTAPGEGTRKTWIAVMLAVAVVVAFASDRRIVGEYMDLAQENNASTMQSSASQSESVGKGVVSGDSNNGTTTTVSTTQVLTPARKPPTKLFFPKKFV